MDINHKAGFVNIIGMPNVGKSTLINRIIGEKVAITSPKIQTTRHRILGFLNSDDYQIIFSDTPGIIDDPKYPMQEAMMDFVHEAWVDADVILYLVEIGQPIRPDNPIIQKLINGNTPYFLVINKIDLSDMHRLDDLVDALQEFIPASNIIPISARHNFNIEQLVKSVLRFLPEHPAYFDKDIYTDKSERFLVSELIREKIFEQFRQEIPYSVEVVVTEYKDTEELLSISAEIYVNRKSQKSILIGKGGAALTKIGKTVREDLIRHHEKRIYLNLYVKTKEGWRENEKELKRFGYHVDKSDN